MTQLARRFPLSLIAATVALSACGPEFSVIPQNGAPHVTANAANVYMSAFADQWDSEPHDLANSLTPIAVDLYNGTGTEIRVSLSDFALRTEAGIRIPALNPFTEPVAKNDDVDDSTLKTGPLLAGPLLGPVGLVLASRGGGGGGHGGGRGGGMHFSGGRRGGSVGPPPGRSWSGGWHGGMGGGPRWGRGFYVSGGLRGYYGPSALYWSGPWGYGSGAYVSAWGAGGGYADAPSGDTIDLALPEGVLAPGAHVNGFIYFRKATAPDVRTLLLAWTPVDARTSAPIGEARIVLDVVRH